MVKRGTEGTTARVEKNNFPWNIIQYSIISGCMNRVMNQSGQNCRINLLKGSKSQRKESYFICPRTLDSRSGIKGHNRQQGKNSQKSLSSRSCSQLRKIRQLKRDEKNMINNFCQKKSHELFPEEKFPKNHDTNSLTLCNFLNEHVASKYEKVKFRGVLCEGTFSTIYRGFLVSKPYEEIIIKKVEIDLDHISRQQEFAKVLKNPYIVKFLGTYYSTSLKKEKGKNRVQGRQSIHEYVGEPGQESEVKELNIMMEKYETDLQKIIETEKINPLMVKLYLYQMLRALNYIHSYNICHRDIKPDNFLVKGLNIALCDFGASKKYSNSDQNEKSVTYIQERPYRAPELLFDYAGYDTKVDIWALACVGAEMVSGKVLFGQKSNLDQLIGMIRVLEVPNWKSLSFIQKEEKQVPKIPKFQNIGLESQLPKEADKKLITLLKRMLIFEPNKRITAIEALCDSYFNELRDENILKQIPRGKVLPNLYYFTKKQTYGKEHFNNILVPFWVKEHCKKYQISVKDFTFV